MSSTVRTQILLSSIVETYLYLYLQACIIVYFISYHTSKTKHNIVTNAKSILGLPTAIKLSVPPPAVSLLLLLLLVVAVVSLLLRMGIKENYFPGRIVQVLTVWIN